MIVELNTPKGSIFSGQAGDVTLHTTAGVLAITPREECYLSLARPTQITLRVDCEFRTFAFRSAAASLREVCLIVLAEEVRPLLNALRVALPPKVIHDI